MDLRRWLLSAALLVGCAHKVDIALPATPAVPLADSAVSIVTTERACAAISEEIVDAINDLPGVVVVPRAPVRLYVTGCDVMLRPTIDVTQHANSSWTVQQQRRRAQMNGRAVAMIAIVSGDQPQAHLVAAARATRHGSVRDMPRMRRQVLRAIRSELATDVAEQIRPLPRLVARQVWPNAPVSSARGLHSRAVQAELIGDYRQARQFALQAYQANPSDQALTYLHQMDSLLTLTP